METRHKVEQVKACLDAVQNPKNPLHNAVNEKKSNRQVMDGTNRTVNQACVLSCRAQASNGPGKHLVEFKSYFATLPPKKPGPHCHDWPAGEINAER